MADGENKMVSPRGAFFVGLSLGLGVAVVLFVIQTERLKNEVNHLREDVMFEHKKWSADHGALLEKTTSTSAPDTANK